MNACVQLVLQEVAPKQVDVLVNNAGKLYHSSLSLSLSWMSAWGSDSSPLPSAGIVSGRSFLELTPAHIRRTFEVNTLSHFWFTQALLPSMIKAKKDAMIVTVASVVRCCCCCCQHIMSRLHLRHANTLSLSPSLQLGIASGANLTDYCASKAATIAYHESRTSLAPLAL